MILNPLTMGSLVDYNYSLTEQYGTCLSSEYMVPYVPWWSKAQALRMAQQAPPHHLLGHGGKPL